MQQRITQITLAPEGGQIFAEGNYTITATDEGGGEFIEVAELQSADAPKIRIDKSDWSSLRAAIDRMMGEIRPDYEEAEAEAAWKDPLTEKLKKQDAERLAGTEQGQQSIDLPDSVLRLVAIGIEAERYALSGVGFGGNALMSLDGRKKDAINSGRACVAELIAEARK